MKSVACWLVLLVAVSGFAAEPKETWEIHGEVVDEQGHPVEDFVAATFWSANGKQWDEQGERIKLRGQSEMVKFWKDEGVIAAWPKFTGKGTSLGRFTIAVEDRPRVSIFATDLGQKRGGYVSVEKNATGEPVTIKLVPLVRVSGKIYCPEAQRTPDWTMAVIHPPGDKQNYLHFVHCGSIKGEFSFLLPPGPFDFRVYSSSPDAHMPKPHERANNDSPKDMPPWLGGIRVEIPAGTPELSLGTLNVELPAGVGGIKGDYSRYYGEHPPEFSITDARGVPRDFKLADLRGKWVLLEFWTLWCGPCVRESLPALAKLYVEHEKDRDRFEILSICVTADETATTIDEYDRRVAAIVKERWDDKPLPFPVLIDGEGKTGAAYGINSYPTVLLIDPKGRLVKFGDQAMLEDKLAEPRP